MRIPIVCVDERVRQYAGVFWKCFSRPQHRHFVTMLVALLLCHGPRTLSNLFRTVAGAGSVASLSRFLAEAPWDASSVATTWFRRFREQVAPQIAALHAEQRAKRPRRRGRPKATRVTGYLIGDDSTRHKRRGKKMEGLGKHYSTTERRVLTGHSLVQALYVVAGRRCPLAPQVYRQKAVCEAEGVVFASKGDLMAERIRTFEPAADTPTHVLLDSWYSARRIWSTAKARGCSISSGLKSNRLLRIADAQAKRGWRWQDLKSYASKRTENDYQQVVWPNQDGAGRVVRVHVVTTTVRNLGRCQVMRVRDTLDAPLKEVRFWASSDLEADAATLIRHLAVRWDIEVLFADARELLGLDQYQLMSATAMVRLWTLVLATYVFLEEERARLAATPEQHVTIGDAQRAIQRAHRVHLLNWLRQQFQHQEAFAAIVRQLAA
ncbi:MAG: transposase [Chloroflexaceae bacterium]